MLLQVKDRTAEATSVWYWHLVQTCLSRAGGGEAVYVWSISIHLSFQGWGCSAALASPRRGPGLISKASFSQLLGKDSE